MELYMAHNDSGRFSKLNRFFKKNRKDKIPKIVLNISEIESIIGRGLPEVSKSKHSHDTLWNDYSPPSEFWTNWDYSLKNYDHVNQSITFELDDSVNLSFQREPEKEADAFRRMHELTYEEKNKEYLETEPNAEHYISTILYGTDSWVDNKRVAIGGIEESRKTLAMSEELGCNAKYNQLLLNSLVNFNTQKSRRDDFFLNFNKEFPDKNITQRQFNEIEALYRNTISKVDGLDNKKIISLIFEDKAKSYYERCLSTYNSEKNYSIERETNKNHKKSENRSETLSDLKTWLKRNLVGWIVVLTTAGGVIVYLHNQETREEICARTAAPTTAYAKWMCTFD